MEELNRTSLYLTTCLYLILGAIGGSLIGGVLSVPIGIIGVLFGSWREAFMVETWWLGPRFGAVAGLALVLVFRHQRR